MRRRVRGLLNRLSESNVESITQEIAALFRSVPRSVGCQITGDEVLASCSRGPRGNEQYADVFAAFVAGMACLVGMDFSAKILASLAKLFEAGTSQNSISCLPCSRMYVADAYLDTLTGQLAQHRDLTEIFDSAYLCKGLADDLDVPTLSDLHRQLVGEGSHRRFLYSVKFGNCQDYMVNFFDGYDANLVIIEKLPNGVFADPFLLQHFVERKVFLDVAVFGDTNLEIPLALSNRSAVEIQFDLRPSTSMNCNLAIELPLHANLQEEPGAEARAQTL